MGAESISSLMFGPDESLGEFLGLDNEPDTATPSYFSTGPNGITLDNEWREFPFDFVANSISVRSADPENPQPVLISFERPFDEPRHHIHIDTAELPFSMGGESPIGTTHVWAKNSPQATGDATVEIVAMK